MNLKRCKMAKRTLYRANVRMGKKSGYVYTYNKRKRIYRAYHDAPRMRVTGVRKVVHPSWLQRIQAYGKRR